MRLLEVDEFPPPVPEDRPTSRPYAILSHVWEDDELTFSELREPGNVILAQRLRKIRGAQAQAVNDGLSYLWMDTLCIDKSSSAELGEAINSMYRWYQEAAVCYVYLADLDGCPRLSDQDLRRGGETTKQRKWNALFREAQWFTRGWTLQELIAPSRLKFFDGNWNLIGDLSDLALTVSDITGVHLSMLDHTLTPNDFSIAQRMCWAAGRRTTRPEDRAYSLLGLLDMSISIRYGEGTRAFMRLQEAIIERNADSSIFAWEEPLVKDEDIYVKDGRRDSYIWHDTTWTSLLAPSPDVFVGARNIVPTSQPSLPYRMTNIGLQITAQIELSRMGWMLLNCYDSEDPTKAILLNLRCEHSKIRQQQHVTVGHVWLRQRSRQQPLSPVSRLSLMNADQALKLTEQKEIFISSWAPAARDDSSDEFLNIRLQMPEKSALVFDTSEPSTNSSTGSLTWKLEKSGESLQERPTSLAFSMFHTAVGRQSLEDRLIYVRVDFYEKHICIQMQAPEKRRQLQSSVLVSYGMTPGTMSIPAQLKLFPGIMVSTAIRCHCLNDQQWYVLNVWAEERPVEARALQTLWHSIKELSCGSK